MARGSGRMPVAQTLAAKVVAITDNEPLAPPSASAGHTSDLMALSKNDLVDKAEEAGIELPSGVTKREIVALLEG